MTPRRYLIAPALLMLAAALWQSPGKIVADTKVALVLNPGRFLGSALHLWNPLQDTGSIGDQSTGYLVPMGPFFLLTHALRHSPGSGPATLDCVAARRRILGAGPTRGCARDRQSLGSRARRDGLRAVACRALTDRRQLGAAARLSASAVGTRPAGAGDLPDTRDRSPDIQRAGRPRCRAALSCSPAASTPLSR